MLRFTNSGGRLVKPRSQEPYPLCCYEKSDLGRDSVQVRSCQDYLFAKHRTAYRRYGADFERRCRAKADLHAARFAWHNRRWPLALHFAAGACSPTRVRLSPVAQGVLAKVTVRRFQRAHENGAKLGLDYFLDRLFSRFRRLDTARLTLVMKSGRFWRCSAATFLTISREL